MFDVIWKVTDNKNACSAIVKSKIYTNALLFVIALIISFAIYEAIQFRWNRVWHIQHTPHFYMINSIFILCCELSALKLISFLIVDFFLYCSRRHGHCSLCFFAKYFPFITRNANVFSFLFFSTYYFKFCAMLCSLQ